MTVPDYQTFMRPLLAAADDGDAHQIGALREKLADEFDLSEEDRSERLPSGADTTLRNRVGWAATYLYRAGLLDRPRRAHYEVSERGREVLASNPDRVDMDVLSQFEEFREFRAGDSSDETGSSEHDAAPTLTSESTTTPEEQMERGYRQLRSNLATELLDRVRSQSPEFFEDLVLDVLRAMGYGGPRGSSERLGRSGDAGVDGVIREDALGLDRVYVQAKRWSNNIQRPEIQGFYGALEGKRAAKGVFITTSDFSASAKEYAEGVSRRIVLVTGRELAEYMIEHGVGVTVEHSFEVKRIDLDYFVDEEIDEGIDQGPEAQ